MSAPYRPGDGLQNWTRSLPNRIQPGVMISGHGSPEGVIPSPLGKLYVDVDTLDLYQKERSGGMAVGWVLRGAVTTTGSGGTGGGTQPDGWAFGVQT